MSSVAPTTRRGILAHQAGVPWSLALLLTLLRPAGVAGEGPPAVLDFLQPTNHAVFSTTDEVPIMLRASAPDDVFLSAEVFGNSQPIASVSYCCSLCPCARPQPGQETILQIPVPWSEGHPPLRAWQGWTNVTAGVYELTARAAGENGSVVEAVPVTITVLDLGLEIFIQSDGSVMLVIREGALVPGGYDLEASPDLYTWTRLGSFGPGDVAAFYHDRNHVFARRFYRSVYVPPHTR
jgi:hypothetical protein